MNSMVTFALFFSALLLAAAEQPSRLTSKTAANHARVPAAAAASTPANPDYRIGIGDVLQVTVWKEEDASVPSIQVRSDGRITLPLVRDVELKGLTLPEAEALISEKLTRYVRTPDVTVLVREINSEKIYVFGAVRREGAYPLRSQITVLQALAEAGGLTDYAKKKKIYVLRSQNNQQVRLPFNYETVIVGNTPQQNIMLRPGDTVVVPQ